MTVLIVGSGHYATIAAAMAAATGGDTIELSHGYKNETAVVTVQDLSVTGGASSSNIHLTLGPGIGDVTLLGLARIDVTDNVGENTITGNAGNNTIHVSAGNDVVHGGGGIDHLIIDYSAVTSTITGTVGGVTDGGTHSVLFDGVENFTILTGAGDDTITTADGDNLIRSGGGNDTISTGDGHSHIYAGDGNDTVTTGDGGDKVDAGQGDNTVTTGDGNDSIRTGAGNDTIKTGGGADRIQVTGGIDTLDSGSGSDRLTVNYDHAATGVTGGMTAGSLSEGYSGLFSDSNGDSVSFLNTEIFRIIGGQGNDHVATGDGNDILSGNAGDDWLSGAGGRDHLYGGGGADTLIGGDGADVLGGGAGNDTFVFTATSDSTVAAPDTILDFGPGDRIDLHLIDADTGVAGDQAFHLGASAGHAGDIVVGAFSGGQTVVDLYVNDDATPDAAIILNGDHHALTAGDFVL